MTHFLVLCWNELIFNCEFVETFQSKKESLYLINEELVGF